MMKEGGDQENKPSSARGSLGRLPDPPTAGFTEHLLQKHPACSTVFGKGTVTAAEEQESTPEI